MRKFLNLFSVPSGEKVTERHLLRVLLCSVVCMVLCMSCLVGTTWAWYQTSIVSQGNEIRIGSFTASVTMQKGARTSGAPLSPDSDEYTYKLNEVGTYHVTINNNGSVEGYCTIILVDAQGNSESFTSGTLYPADDTDANDSVTISITIDAQDKVSGILPVMLKIYPSWGKDPNQEVADINEEVFAPETEPTEETTSPTEETTAESTPETQPDSATEPTTETQPDSVTEPTTETQPDSTTEPTTETQPDTTTEPTTETQPDSTTEPITESQPDSTAETQSTDSGKDTQQEPANGTNPQTRTTPAADATESTESTDTTET